MGIPDFIVLIFCLGFSSLTFYIFLKFLEKKDQGLGPKNFMLIVSTILVPCLLAISLIGGGDEKIYTLWGAVLGYIFTTTGSNENKCSKKEKSTKEDKQINE